MHMTQIRSVLAKTATAGFFAFAGMVAPAQAQQVALIRDAEVERLVKDFAAPLTKAAGIKPLEDVKIVSDRRFNAFVVEDGTLFINYGTIIEAKTPGELKAVVAHEIGHLAGGHLARLREQAQSQAIFQVISMVLGAGAMAAASQSGAGDLSQVASAFLLASQSAGINSLMAYRRGEETAADSAALKLLARTGQSAKGMVDVLTALQHDQTLAISPYLRTHPLAEDRLDQVSRAAKASKYWGRQDPASDVAAFRLAKAKLVGFLESQQSVLNRYPNSDKSQAARYARIIAAYKSGATISALQIMPQLVAESPSNPYFQELLGQMYFETGQAQKALAPLKRAVALAPRETLIRLLYGQALVDAGGAANMNEALAQLNRAAREEPKSGRTYALLARAYAALGRQGDASLAAAEAALANNQKGTALGLAHKAQAELNTGSPAWLRADDILNMLQ